MPKTGKKWIINTEGRSSLVLAFAAKELQKYLGGDSGGGTILLREKIPVGSNDGFRIQPCEDSIVLEGNNARSVLFAVYAFIEKYSGVKWFYPGEETRTGKKQEIKAEEFIPSFTDRGLNVETRLYPDAYIGIIDWMAKNKMNNVAVPFNIWDEYRDIIAPEIERRGLNVTLAGHSYFYFVPPERYFAKYPEWFALIDGRRHQNGQFCFAALEMQEVFCQNVLEYLQKQPIAIYGLSIWPADNSLYCTCPACSQKSFVENYCSLISRLKEHLMAAGLDVKLNHLAYNAGLSDMMISPVTNTAVLNGIDTQLAYWGRNYADSIAAPGTDTDIQARRHITSWMKLHQKMGSSFQILEYYTDFWMLTSIYPPLTKIIAQDISFYHDIGVKGMFSLIVSCDYGMFKDKNYPSQWIMGLNMYLFAQLLWNCRIDVPVLLREYFDFYYGGDAVEAEKYFILLEKLIPQLTAFNVPLFRLRFPDVWQVDIDGAIGGTKFLPQAWSPADAYGETEIARDEVCENIYAALRDVHVPASNGIVKNIDKARAYFTYVKEKITALRLQLDAQKYLRNQEQEKARQSLEKAIDIEKKLYGENIEDCQKWCNTLQG